MKKLILITFSVLVILGIASFLWSQHIQKQKIEARTTIDTAFNLFDVTKDYFDQFKGCLDVGTIAKLNDGRQFLLALETNDLAEKAFKDGEYSKAIDLGRETANLVTEYRNQFDTVVLPRKSANLCN